VIPELLAFAALTAHSGEPACAVSRSTAPTRRYGGRALWTHLPEAGTINAPWRLDGTLGWKLGWSAKREYAGGLAVTGARLDTAAPRMTVLAVRWGRSSTGQGGWATAVTFPSPGCWRITGRAAGARLSYTVRVVPS
jgi:hypothetical protein